MSHIFGEFRLSSLQTAIYQLWAKLKFIRCIPRYREIVVTDNILFTYESHFYLHRQVNNQNNALLEHEESMYYLRTTPSLPKNNGLDGYCFGSYGTKACQTTFSFHNLSEEEIEDHWVSMWSDMLHSKRNHVVVTKNILVLKSSPARLNSPSRLGHVAVFCLGIFKIQSLHQ